MRGNKIIISNKVKINKEKTRKTMETDSNGKETITPTSNSKTRKDSGKKISITTKTKPIKKEAMESRWKLQMRPKSFTLAKTSLRTMETVRDTTMAVEITTGSSMVGTRILIRDSNIITIITVMVINTIKTTTKDNGRTTHSITIINSRWINHHLLQIQMIMSHFTQTTTLSNQCTSKCKT